MKDIIITAGRIRTELVTMLICFVVGFVANIGAIIFYKTAVKEIFTSLPYVVVFTFVIYCLWSLLRLLKWMITIVLIKYKK